MNTVCPVRIPNQTPDGLYSTAHCVHPTVPECDGLDCCTWELSPCPCPPRLPAPSCPPDKIPVYNEASCTWECKCIPGQTDPHLECINGTCTEVQGCNTNYSQCSVPGQSCTGSGSGNCAICLGDGDCVSPPCLIGYTFWCDVSIYTCQIATPILIDVSGNGFNLTDGAGGVSFNLTGTRVVQTAWTAPNSDDAWLTLDRNDNGKIDGGAELFGNDASHPADLSGTLRQCQLLRSNARRSPPSPGPAAGSTRTLCRMRRWRPAPRGRWKP